MEEDVALLPVDNPYVLVVGVMLASILQVLDSTIANVALPHMQATLGATSDEISWVLTSYIVATAVAMPMTGWLADRVGSRRLFLVSVAGFVLSSMLCGMAQNIGEMVLFRALQGITGAFISPLSQTIMIDTNKPSRQPQMMAIWGMGMMLGPILGPLIGGWLTENWNWRAVFYVNVPLGIIALSILLPELPSRPIARRPFDRLGYALVALLLTSVQLLLDRGNHVDWFQSAESWIYAAIAICALWVAVIHFATASNTLFDRHILTDPTFAMAAFFSAIVGVVMFANMALLPSLLQGLMGYDVIDTGWAMMPRGVGVLLSMQLSGFLLRRGVDSRLLMGIGFIGSAYSMYMMTQWSLEMDYATIAISGFVQGLGMGMVFIPLNSTAFSSLPPRLRTDGPSVLNLGRSIGSSVGISVVTTLLARNIQVNHEELAARVTGAVLEPLDMSTIDRFQQLGEAGLRVADGLINRQAAMIAYLDDFWLMMWMSLLAAVLLPLMRKAVIQKVGPAAKDVPH